LKQGSKFVAEYVAQFENYQGFLLMLLIHRRINGKLTNSDGNWTKKWGVSYLELIWLHMPRWLTKLQCRWSFIRCERGKETEKIVLRKFRGKDWTKWWRRSGSWYGVKFWSKRWWRRRSEWCSESV